MGNVWKRGTAFFLMLLVLLQLSTTKMIYASEIQESEIQESDIQATISVASNMSKQDMQVYLDGFHKKYPGITIEYLYYSDYENEVAKHIEDNDYADVLFVPGYMPADQYADYFEPLGTREELDKKYNYLDGGKNWDGNIYGIPYSAYLNGILYNKAVFDKAGITEPPKSIDEFLEALQAIKERTDAIPFYTNYAAGWPLQNWEQYPFIEMTGDPDYRENGFVNELNPFLEGTSHYQVYGLLYNIVQEELCEPDPSQSDWEASKEMLNKGQIGCMAIGSWALNQVKNAGPNRDDVAFIPFPNQVDGKQYMTIVADYSYGINKNSEQKEAARCYIDYMLDESGYALDHEVLSLVKTDPFLESYGNMDDVVCLRNNEASDENYRRKAVLSTNLNLLDSYDEIKRVIEAAMGLRSETFDEIAEDWNERWESSRTEDMMPATGENISVLSSAISNNYEVDFSKTEEEYLSGLETLHVGYLKNMAPYEYQTENGYEGVSKELIDQMEQEMGVTVLEKGYENTRDLIEALKAGEIDIAAGVQKKTEYGADVKYSADYMEYLNVIVKRDKTSTDEVLKGTMAQIDGEYYSDYKTDAADILMTEDLKGSLKAVESMKADFTVANYYSAYFYMQEQGYSHLITIPLAQNGKFYFAFSKDVDTRMISICNKLIYSVPNENMQMILNDSLQQGQQKITVRRFIQANLIPCLLTLCVLFLLIIVVIWVVMRDRAKIAKMDALTGLNNRYGMREQMTRLYEKKLFPIAFAVMDIDNFKSVNDTLGHAGGDEVLKLLAENLKKVFGDSAILGRYGGDEFILCINCQEIEFVEAKIKELVKSMDQTFSYGEASVPVSISLGAVYAKQSDSFEELFNKADEVLYEVKERGKNGFLIQQR